MFTVTLTGTRTGSVTVDYATTAGTASQGSDYTHTSGALTFATNESSKTISVPTVEDTTEEQTETFTVNLSNPSAASIQDGTATGHHHRTTTEGETRPPCPSRTRRRARVTRSCSPSP